MPTGYASAAFRVILKKALKIVVGCFVIAAVVYGLFLIANFGTVWFEGEAAVFGQRQLLYTTYVICGIYVVLVLIGKF